MKKDIKKSKIAISLDKPLLNIIDQYVDNDIIRSRSHAIENLLKKALKNEPITTAVILVHEDHQDHLFQKFDSKTLLEKNVEFLKKYGIKNIFLITKNNIKFNNIRFSGVNFKVIDEKKSRGTGYALNLVKNKLPHTFVVLNGDTFNDFNLLEMVKNHFNSEVIATIGLTSIDNPEKKGSAVLDGNYVIDFKEKQKTDSFVINSGIYILNFEIFNSFSQNTRSLESEVFSKLSKERKLGGFFTYGTFIHAPDKIN